MLYNMEDSQQGSNGSSQSIPFQCTKVKKREKKSYELKRC